MTPQDLRANKLAVKALSGLPSFKPVKKGALPPPFHRYKSKRLQTTGMLEVSSEHELVFFWRDGEILTDRAFYGHLFKRLSNGGLFPVFEFHWHPSHKGFHCKVPCKTNEDYSNRTIPSGPELNMSTTQLDPASEKDRESLMRRVCVACGVWLPPPPPETMQLFPK